MDLHLKDKSAVVTGASAGIGRAIALALAGEGVRLALVARGREALEAVADEIGAAGSPRPAVIAQDVTEPGAARAVATAARAALGRIEILANSAGGRRPSGAAPTEEEWESALLLNFSQQRRLTAELVPDMITAGFGRIVNITGKSEPTRMSPEFSAKAAMHAWSKGLSRDLGPHGITVNCLAPGRFLTAQMQRNYTPQQREEHARDIPVGRYGQPAEMAAVACFLCSPVAAYITGTVIPVDGGLRRYQF